VVELVGIGPGPFCGMVLGDLGADVIEVDRIGGQGPAEPSSFVRRGRRSLALDLKRPEAVDVLLRLLDRADVLIDPFRPGVTERLGIGPDVCLDRNPRLVYGRMTGYGQDGPWASHAGHDINYIALAGALEGMGRAGQPPTPPVNYLGDFGGGAMLCLLGVVAALYERERSGRGQVVDAAMVDGVALLTAFLRSSGTNLGGYGPRGTHYLDTGAPQYDTYETADGRWVAIGCNEPQFYARLVTLLGLADDPELGTNTADSEQWPARKARFAEVFRARPLDEWEALLGDEPQVCYAPVLTFDEAPRHPHLIARRTYVEVDGVVQPAAAPRFSRTPGEVRPVAPADPAATDALLAELGLASVEVAALRAAGAIA
jgi:alpha-methylacyl-CoA racemase